MNRTVKLATELATIEVASPRQLHELWPQYFDFPAPSVASGIVRRLLAHRAQELCFGGLLSGISRELERWANGPPPSTPRPMEITPGSRFIREWNGETIDVQALEKGFAWNGQTYNSLTEIARKVTGAHWSGPRFFGLNRRG